MDIPTKNFLFFVEHLRLGIVMFHARKMVARTYAKVVPRSICQSVSWGGAVKLPLVVNLAVESVEESLCKFCSWALWISWILVYRLHATSGHMTELVLYISSMLRNMVPGRLILAPSAGSVSYKKLWATGPRAKWDENALVVRAATCCGGGMLVSCIVQR